MSYASINEVTDGLRGLPDMRPPADAWSRLCAHQARPWFARPFAWAAAAGVALMVAGVMRSGEEVVVPAADAVMVVAAPSAVVDEPSVRMARAAQVHELRMKSAQLERRLAGLPRRNQLVRADIADMVADLQDRIAAVDYELNRAGSPPPTTARWPSSAPAAIQSVGRPDRSAPDELWAQRVRLMNRLVDVRFAEAGAAAY